MSCPAVHACIFACKAWQASERGQVMPASADAVPRRRVVQLCQEPACAAGLGGRVQWSRVHAGGLKGMHGPHTALQTHAWCCRAGVLSEAGLACAGVGALLAGSAGAADGVLGAGERGLRGCHQPRRAAAHAPDLPGSQLGPDGPALSWRWAAERSSRGPGWGGLLRRPQSH